MKELGHCFPKSKMVSSYSTDQMHTKNNRVIPVLNRVFFDKIQDYNINWTDLKNCLLGIKWPTKWQSCSLTSRQCPFRHCIYPIRGGSRLFLMEGSKVFIGIRQFFHGRALRILLAPIGIRSCYQPTVLKYPNTC